MIGPMLGGLLFGLIVGAIMRLPGADAVDAAFAINLSVMASLWLGASFASADDGQDARMKTEVFGAMVAYVCAGAALQHSTMWLFVGFAFQAIWSGLHIAGQFGAVVRSWFPPFATAANLGFLICYLILTRLI